MSQKKNKVFQPRKIIVNTTIEFIDTDLIIPSPDNPRIMNESSLEFLDLVDSIRASGVLIPVHVRNHPKQKGKYDLLAGERRLVAVRICQQKTIPAIVHDGMSDEMAFELTFAENFAREDLTVMEQGRAGETLMRKYKNDTEAVASKMGKSIRWVRQRIALAKNLSKAVKEAIEADPIFTLWTASHWQRVASFPVETQEDIVDQFYGDDRPPTIKELDEYLKEKLSVLSKAPWDLKDDKLLPKAKACSRCPKRSSAQPGLFDETMDTEAIKKNDRCLDKECWQQKMRAYLESRSKEIRAEHPKLIGAVTSGQQLLHNEAYNIRQQYGEIATDYKPAKEGDKDAVPALIVTGTDVGKLQFIKLKHQKQGSPAVKGGTARIPTPLKDRRAMLDKKRWFVTVQEVLGLLTKKQADDITTKDKALTVMGLAAEFGTKFVYREDGQWRNFTKRTDAAEILYKLWNRVKESIVDKLTYTGPITQTPDYNIDGAKVMAKLTGIDVKAIYKKVSQEKYPVPKSWAKLNEDGTQKKTGAKVKPKCKSSSKTAKSR